MGETNLQDKEMLVCMQELTNEMKELRLVISRQPIASEGISIVPVKETRITENKLAVDSYNSRQIVLSGNIQLILFVLAATY